MAAFPMKLKQLSRTSAEEPRVRGSWCAMLRKEIEAFEPDVVERIEERMGADFDRAIDEAGRLGWVPAEMFARFLDTVQDVVGEARFLDYYHRVVMIGQRSPLLRVSTAAAVRLFGRRGMLKTFAPGWELVARGCGRISVGQSDDEVLTVVEFASLPDVLAGSSAWPNVCKGSLTASAQAGGFDHQVVLTESEPGRLCFEMTLHPKTASSATGGP